MKLPSYLRQSHRSLRKLLVFYWLGSTLLISLVLVAIDLWDHQQHIVKDGEQAAHLVDAALRTAMPSDQRQKLVEAYGQGSDLQPADSLNVLLVLDRLGTIIHSSRPTWRTMRIDDRLFDQMEGDDPDFREVVECFRLNRRDCLDLRSVDWHFHLGGFNVLRQVSMPPSDIGLPRQSFLVLANFDAGMLISEVSQDLPGLILLAALSSMLLCGTLWITISGQVVPQLLEMTQTDALTQLMNRTSFMELCMDLLAEAEERRADLVFAILDIDHFKQINDTYGHGCGDAALASVGSLLRTVTRPDDLVCRFGGEEFAMLLSVPRDSGGKALERLRLQLEMNRVHDRGHRIPITVSIGAAATSDCGYNIDFLYNSADKALYAAKNAGRNRLEWHTGEVVSRLPFSTPRVH